MPSKNKRAASRQAKLSQRARRKGGNRKQRSVQLSSVHSEKTPVESGQRRPTATESARPQTVVAAATTRSVQRRTPSAAAPQARTRAAQNRAATSEPLPMYGYLGSELRRIGVITAIMAAALAALTLVLG